MWFRPRLVALLCVGGCSFPTDGVPLDTADDVVVPDAETVPDACDSGPEECDGLDNDCDGTTDEGFASGDACDGPDDDLCEDDMMVCGDGGGEICGDTSGDDDVEQCNGPDLDEDCDGATDEGFGVGGPCDGADTDVCTEGSNACAPDGLGVVCGDASGNNVELCDPIDQDCDGSSTNGFDLNGDEANCGACGVACSNANATTTTCTAGDCNPACSNGAAQCNGNPDDGCEVVDTNPLCAMSPAGPDFTIRGDDTTDNIATTTGISERFFRIRVQEHFTGNDPGITRAPTASITLTSGAGTDFDLRAYCTADCASVPLTEATDVIQVGRPDTNGSNTFDVIVEVRYDPTTPSTTCAPWTLTITGNIENGATTCPG